MTLIHTSQPESSTHAPRAESVPAAKIAEAPSRVRNADMMGVTDPRTAGEGVAATGAAVPRPGAAQYRDSASALLASAGRCIQFGADEDADGLILRALRLRDKARGWHPALTVVEGGRS